MLDAQPTIDRTRLTTVLDSATRSSSTLCLIMTMSDSGLEDHGTVRDSAGPSRKQMFGIGICLDVGSQRVAILPRHESIKLTAKLLIQFLLRLRDGMQIPI